MSIVNYQFYSDEGVLKSKIDNLDKVANSYLLKISDLYIEDLFFMSVIDKSIKLIDTFLFALEKRNLTVLATLTRVQIDCTIRAYATTLVSDSGDFCKAVLLDDAQVNRLKDINNRKLTDKYLCESLGTYLNLPIYDLYKKVCGFVHFSSDSFHSIAKAQKENDITLLIGRKNREEDKEVFERLSIELANQFYFFGSVLIEDVFASWLRQKNEFLT